MAADLSRPIRMCVHNRSGYKGRPVHHIQMSTFRFRENGRGRSPLLLLKNKEPDSRGNIPNNQVHNNNVKMWLENEAKRPSRNLRPRISTWLKNFRREKKYKNMWIHTTHTHTHIGHMWECVCIFWWPGCRPLSDERGEMLFCYCWSEVEGVFIRKNDAYSGWPMPKRWMSSWRTDGHLQLLYSFSRLTKVFLLSLGIWTRRRWVKCVYTFVPFSFSLSLSPKDSYKLSSGVIITASRKIKGARALYISSFLLFM